MAEHRIIAHEQRTLIKHLLRERISLRGICREVLQELRHDQDLGTAYTLTQRFRQMMRARAASTLELDLLRQRMLHAG
jgi:hypothetical protein